jgi:hypothetical protein
VRFESRFDGSKLHPGHCGLLSALKIHSRRDAIRWLILLVMCGRGIFHGEQTRSLLAAFTLQLPFPVRDQFLFSFGVEAITHMPCVTHFSI